MQNSWLNGRLINNRTGTKVVFRSIKSDDEKCDLDIDLFRTGYGQPQEINTNSMSHCFVVD